jgi:hypothetical protein
VSEVYWPSDRRLSAKLLPTFADRGCHVVSATDPYGRNVCFIDWIYIYIYFETLLLKVSAADKGTISVKSLVKQYWLESMGRSISEEIHIINPNSCSIVEVTLQSDVMVSSPVWDLWPDTAFCPKAVSWKLLSCLFGAPSLTRGRVCHLSFSVCNNSSVFTSSDLYVKLHSVPSEYSGLCSAIPTNPSHALPYYPEVWPSNFSVLLTSVRLKKRIQIEVRSPGFTLMSSGPYLRVL